MGSEMCIRDRPRAVPKPSSAGRSRRHVLLRNPMSTSGGGAVIDSMDTTTYYLGRIQIQDPEALYRLHPPAPALTQEPPTKGTAPGLSKIGPNGHMETRR